MSLHVLFEGLDLAGKSTTTGNFIEANPLNMLWEHREKSIVARNPIRDAATTIKHDTRFTDGTMGWLHYASFLGDLDVYEPPEFPVAQESVTAFRSIAYHSVFGDKDLAAKFIEKLPDLDIFSDTFLITASIEARQYRLERRRRENPSSVSFLDELVEQEPSKFVEMEKIMFDAVYQATGAPVHILDTGELTPRSVLSAAISHVTAPTLFDSSHMADVEHVKPNQATELVAEAG